MNTLPNEMFLYVSADNITDTTTRELLASKE